MPLKRPAEVQSQLVEANGLSRWIRTPSPKRKKLTRARPVRDFSWQIALFLLDLDQDHGDVIEAASGIGLLDQSPAGFFQTVIAGQDLGYLSVLDHSGQTVSAEKQPVAFVDLDQRQIGLGGRLGSKSTGDDAF